MKLSYPFLVFMLAKRAFACLNAPDLQKFLPKVFLVSFLCFVVSGGFALRFYPFLWSKASGWMWNSAAVADHLAIMGVAALAMWKYTKNKKYLIYTILAAISPVLVSIRTGIGAYILGASAVLWIGFPKRTAIPIIAMLVFLGLYTVLFVSNVRDHMFHDSHSVNTAQALQDPALITWNQINTSGRESMWKFILRKLYDPDPLFGSGLGATQHLMYSRGGGTTLSVVHSGYVEYLCDTGLIGLGCYLFIILLMLLNAWHAYASYSLVEIKLFSLFTVGGIFALHFCMGFDNTNNYVLVATQYPFIFAGILSGLIEKQKRRLWKRF